MPDGRRKRILIVEDEEKIARLLAEQLVIAGYEAHPEFSGQAGLDDAAERQPDLVVLDLRLPDVSGFDVCRQLRAMYPSWLVPILIVTALDQPAVQVRGYTYGADAYLTKPFEFAELLNIIAGRFGQAMPA